MHGVLSVRRAASHARPPVCAVFMAQMRSAMPRHALPPDRPVSCAQAWRLFPMQGCLALSPTWRLFPIQGCSNLYPTCLAVLKSMPMRCCVHHAYCPVHCTKGQFNYVKLYALATSCALANAPVQGSHVHPPRRAQYKWVMRICAQASRLPPMQGGHAWQGTAKTVAVLRPPMLDVLCGEFVLFRYGWPCTNLLNYRIASHPGIVRTQDSWIRPCFRFLLDLHSFSFL